MIASFIISFREAFEALLITVIIISYLKKTGRSLLVKPVVAGGITAVVSSIVLGIIVHVVFSIAIETINKALVEFISAFIAVLVLTSVIYWMTIKGPRIRHEIEREIESRVRRRRSLYLGMATLGFIVVFREGVETVLFMAPLLLRDIASTLMGLAFGVISVLLLSYFLLHYSIRMNIRTFFYVTSILLVFIASGILGYGIHELIEYVEDSGLSLGLLGEKVYSINLDPSNPFSEEGVVGSILSVLVGYTTEMELLRMIAQFSYLAIALTVIVRAYRKVS